MTKTALRDLLVASLPAHGAGPRNVLTARRYD
jgi:hypothetical protein